MTNLTRFNQKDIQFRQILPQFFYFLVFLPMADPQQAQHHNLSSSRAKSTVNGIRQLLTASNECEYVKKRIKVLENIQNHNQAKVRQYKLSLDKFENVKAQKQHSNQTKLKMMKKIKEMESEQKQFNMKIRHERKNKISQVLREIQDQKVKDRNRIREQSQNIAQKIQKNREKQLLQKRERRNRVVQIERESKQNYRYYFQQKRDDLARRAQNQLQDLEQRKKQKQAETKNMSAIQNAILNKQNQTKQEFSSVKTKLAEIYGVEPKNTKSSVSMHCRDASNRTNTDGFRVSKG